MLAFTGERAVPWADGMREWPHVLRDHINRYAFTLPYVAGKSVCDVGCGTGYGAYLMSMVARVVTGYDVSAEAVAFAHMHFGRDEVLCRSNGAYFHQSDATAWAMDGYDVYTCFEVLEHVDDPQTILRNIPAQATLIWSVPVDDPGRFHKRVYADRYEAAGVVPNSEIFYQNDSGEIVREGDMKATPKYIIGVRKGAK